MDAKWFQILGNITSSAHELRNHSPWHHDEEYDLHASNQVPSAVEPATYRVSERKKIYRY